MNARPQVSEKRKSTKQEHASRPSAVVFATAAGVAAGCTAAGLLQLFQVC